MLSDFIIFLQCCNDGFKVFVVAQLLLDVELTVNSVPVKVNPVPAVYVVLLSVEDIVILWFASSHETEVAPEPTTFILSVPDPDPPATNSMFTLFAEGDEPSRL